MQTPTSLLRSQTRGLHRIPQLQHDATYKENGVPEFMSPEAFDFSWTQYQTLLVDKLNLLTQGEPASDSRGYLMISSNAAQYKTKRNQC